MSRGMTWLGLCVVMVLFPLLSTPSGAATPSLTTGIGNVSGGPIEQQATKIASEKLTGPKGSGLTRGVTSSSVTVGCVYTESDYPGFESGIKGAFAVANKTGVAGRKLKLIPCMDDASNPQTDVTETHEVVAQDNAFAVMSVSQEILPASTNYLVANQVPFYGWGFNPGFCGTCWGFGFSGCTTGNGYPLPIEGIQGSLAAAPMKAAGLKPSQVRLAAQNENSPSGQAGAAEYAAIFKAAGAKVVYNATNLPATTVSDYTPYVNALLATKPNMVIISTAFSDVGPMASALRAAGYKGSITDYVSYVPGLLASSPQLADSLQGENILVQFVPQEQNSPYVKTVRAALQLANQPSSQISIGANIGYAEGTMLVEQLQAIGKNLNTKTFDQAINDDHFANYKGLLAKGGLGLLNWPAGHYLPLDCSAIVQAKGTSYKVALPYACYQTIKVNK